MQQSEYITLSDVAEMLGESKATVNRKVRSGEIPSKKLDGPLGAYLIARTVVEGLLAKRAEELTAELDKVNEAKTAMSS